MPNLRAEILKKVFKEGIDSVSKKELDHLFKTAPTKSKGLTTEMPEKLFHYSEDPKGLMQKGFDPNKPGPIIDWDEMLRDEPGLYWSSRKWAIPEMAAENEITPTALRRNTIVGLPRPGASVAKPLRTDNTTNDFIKNALAFEDADEIIQKRAGNVLAKYRDLYRILGLAGALGVEDIWNPKDKK